MPFKDDAARRAYLAAAPGPRAGAALAATTARPVKASRARRRPKCHRPSGRVRRPQQRPQKQNAEGQPADGWFADDPYAMSATTANCSVLKPYPQFTGRFPEIAAPLAARGPIAFGHIG